MKTRVMKRMLKLVCGVALALTIVPAWLFFTGSVDGELQKHLMLAGTGLWFAAAVPLMRGGRDAE